MNDVYNKIMWWLKRRLPAAVAPTFDRIFNRRDVVFLYQRLTRGWDDSDTWSLDSSLSNLILPRLRRFKQIRGGYPSNMTEDEWRSKLDKMIAAFEYYGSDERWDDKNQCENMKKHQEGLDLFAQEFGNLWW